MAQAAQDFGQLTKLAALFATPIDQFEPRGLGLLGRLHILESNALHHIAREVAHSHFHESLEIG